jgi:hypothetical protein
MHSTRSDQYNKFALFHIHCILGYHSGVLTVTYKGVLTVTYKGVLKVVCMFSIEVLY